MLAMVFLFWAVAAVAIAIALVVVATAPQPQHPKRVVYDVPTGTYRQARGQDLPSLPWNRSWFSRSSWGDWWVVVPTGFFGGPLTPKHFGDRWDGRQWQPARTR